MYWVSDGSLTSTALGRRALIGCMYASVATGVTYGFSMEVVRFFSLIDECFSIPMNWNKLPRQGLTGFVNSGASDLDLIAKGE